MASTIELFCAICFILVRLFLSNGVRGESPKSFNNATDHESPWTSGRSKRSLDGVMPVALYINIEYELGNTENLVFLKTNQMLANRHTPVEAPEDYFFRDTVMNDIGEFVMYQNLMSCSAFVYFGKEKAIFGVIKTDYYIREFSLEWDQDGHVLGILKSPYLVKREGASIQLDPNVISFKHIHNKKTHEMYQNQEQLMNPQAGPSTQPDGIQENTGAMNDKQHYANRHAAYKDKEKKRIPIDYYVETMVFISHDVTEIFYNSYREQYINQIVRYYLVYFNAVDMFFRKLFYYGMKTYINIAKIVIEDDTLNPFDFVTKDEVHFTNLITQLPAYLRKSSYEYPPDSFDHIFIVTDRPIMLETASVRGLTKSGDDLILGRTEKKFYEAVSFTIMRAESYYSGYLHAAEEIGHVFSPNIDPLEYIEHMEWSQNSLNQFKAFFSNNPNRVFFRNKPRSLLPPGPHVLITPIAQCRSLGFHDYVLKSGVKSYRVPTHDCAIPMQCRKGGTEHPHEVPIWPFDGTSCSNSKVCWAEKCVHRIKPVED